MINGTTVKAHTGSTKAGTYKVVTGVIVEYVRRELGPNHYTLDVVIIDADGVTYVTGKGRIIEEVEPMESAEEPQETQEAQNTDLVWVPVSKTEEFQIPFAVAFKVAHEYNVIARLNRTGYQYECKRAIRELLAWSKEFALVSTNQCREVAIWWEEEGSKEFGRRLREAAKGQG